MTDSRTNLHFVGARPTLSQEEFSKNKIKSGIPTFEPKLLCEDIFRLFRWITDCMIWGKAKFVSFSHWFNEWRNCTLLNRGQFNKKVPTHKENVELATPEPVMLQKRYPSGIWLDKKLSCCEGRSTSCLSANVAGTPLLPLTFWSFHFWDSPSG